MKIVLIKTVWGCPEMSSPDEWDELVSRIKQEGFHGVEAAFNGIPDGKHELFADIVHAYGMRLIFQLHTCGYIGREADVLAMGTNNQAIVGSQDPEAHLAYLKKQLTTCAKLKPDLVNCHSGHDSWDLVTAADYLTRAQAIASELGVKMSVETHRRRLLWNPWQARDLMSKVPGLRVTADLSHWVCACERVFGADSDKEWPSILKAVASRCALIHARVGYSEGPQVPHPSAAEVRYEVEQHIGWWVAIARARLAAGDEELFVEPEFGAPGYQRCTPFRRVPEGDLWEINSYMAARVVRAFSEIRGVKVTLPEPMRRVLERCDEEAEFAAAAGPYGGWLDPVSFTVGMGAGLLVFSMGLVWSRQLMRGV